MAKYIDKAELVGERLTSSEQQLRFREMTGTDAYYEFLRLVNDAPTADVAPVRRELRKAVKLLDENYEKGVRNPVIRDPLAWALYQTWKTMDGGADNGG